MARKISFDPLPDEAADPALPAAKPVQRSRPLLGHEPAVRQSSALGAISQSLGGISEKVKRAEEIEQRLLKGQVIVEIDPAIIDNSFVPDRMEASGEQSAAFRELIREHGQSVPILVRPKPGEPERFEVAFGHRRLRAARELGITVKAVVRALTDDQLVVAQGQENSGRTDLTFIERARFAARLEERGFSRDIIMASLNVDKAALSRLIALAKRMPGPLVEAIGPAPAIGRVRWNELADLVDQDGNAKRAMARVGQPDFADLDSDKRFEALSASLRTRPVRVEPETWAAKDGTEAARIQRAGRKLTLVFDDRVTPQFGDFVREKLQALYEEFRAKGSR